MYTPKHFEETRTAVMHDLIRAHPLATLVTLGADGLNANHVPLQVVPGPAGYGTLIGHIARSNPMLEGLNRNADVLAIFQGPDSYISPSWYATKPETGKVVPTWNYAVVHAHGKLVVRDDPAWIRAQMASLTQQMENGFTKPWTIEDAPADFTEKLVGAVVGIEIVVSRLSGKWKVSQNQPERNRESLAGHLRAAGSDEADAMAALVKRRGQD